MVKNGDGLGHLLQCSVLNNLKIGGLVGLYSSVPNRTSVQNNTNNSGFWKGPVSPV